MARQKGTLKISSNLEPLMNAPLDARFTVETKEDLYGLDYSYRGLQVYVIDEDAYYKLINDLPAFEASWVLIGNGEEYDEITESDIDAMFGGSATITKYIPLIFTLTDINDVTHTYELIGRDITENPNSQGDLATVPSGYEALTITLTDSNDVEHTYEVLGKEITE